MTYTLVLLVCFFGGNGEKYPINKINIATPIKANALSNPLLNDVSIRKSLAITTANSTPPINHCERNFLRVAITIVTNAVIAQIIANTVWN